MVKPPEREGSRRERALKVTRLVAEELEAALVEAIRAGDAASALTLAAKGARLLPGHAAFARWKTLLTEAEVGGPAPSALLDALGGPGDGWHLPHIPKKVHFYWGNDRTSYLRYLSVFTFQRLNPDWEVNLYIPTEPHRGDASWKSFESYDSSEFKGRDYSRELFSLPGLRIREVDFSAFPELNEAPEIFKSDFFRWNMLAEEGGIYSDIDILYFRPLAESHINTPANREAKALLCLQEDGNIIGFFGASAGNPLFRFLSRKALEHFDATAYQAIGSTMMNRYFPSEATIQAAFSGMPFVNLPMAVVYPFLWTQISHIWGPADLSWLQPETIGIHWYAGSPTTQRMNNAIVAENAGTFDNIVCRLLQHVQEGTPVPIPRHLPLPRGEGAAPRFSILVPTYNQAGFLAKALDSLLAQTEADWEALVVNDGSRDDTREVMADYAARDARIRVFHQANGGVGSALNAGLRQARGAWICWLSSDDLFEPCALEVFREEMRYRPSARFFYSNFFQLFEETGEKRPIPEVRDLPAQESQLISFFNSNYINGISICIHRSLFDRVGLFNQALRHAQDFDLWLRMSSVARLNFINQRTCTSRVHAGQDSRGFPEAGNFESAFACLDFLNGHGYQALFPFLDLNSVAGATTAVHWTLQIALNPETWIYSSVGHVPALLERLGEWLQEACLPELRAPLREGMASLLLGMPGLPLALRTTLAKMSVGDPVHYQPRDPLSCMEAHLARLEAEGFQEKAAKIRRYLETIAARPRVRRTAYHLEPDWQGDGWAMAILGYLEAFAPRDPVCLTVAHHPQREGEPESGEVQQAILLLAESVGLTSFPDIQVQEEGPDPAAWDRVFRIPDEAGGPEDMTAWFRATFSEAGP